MPLTKLQFRPGISQDLTSYSNEGGWFDCDKVRFRLGYPEKIGGWSKYSDSAFLGSARSLHNWIALDSSNYLGVGTHLKYYIEEGQGFNDITPIRETTSAGDVTFAATDGSSTIVVTDVSHGAKEDDFVTFSGAADLGGNVLGSILNAEYQITRVIDADSYEIVVSVTANASDTGNGGASVVGAYQINTGLDTSIGGTGWGAGLYGGLTNSGLQTTLNEGAPLSDVDTTITVTSTTGIVATDVILIGTELIEVGGIAGNDLTGCTRGVSGTDAATHADGSTVRLAQGNANANSDFNGWGQAATGSSAELAQIRLWSEDNFGEDLIINPRDGAIYYWDKTSNLTSRAVELSTLSAASTSVPTVAKQVMVSDNDRHLIAFGCDGINNSPSATQGNEVQDPLLIRFASQENPNDWYPASTNTAGDLLLGQGSTFVTAVETKREILVWTDTALSSLRYIGPPFTFGIQQLSNNITIMGPNAAVSMDDAVFWMGIDAFYYYEGGTQRIPCPVKDHIFFDFNFDQSDKVYGGVNSEFSEIFWFYPSAGSLENDRYVVFNYVEKCWYYGTINRTAWLDRGTRAYPIAAGNTAGNYLYNHELGNDDDGTAIYSWIESSVMDLQDGEHFAFIRRIIPDLSFVGSTGTVAPIATFTVQARNFPGTAFSDTGSGAVTRTAATPVQTYTEDIDIRVRGRSFAFKIESDLLGTRWKLGSPRIDIRPDGRR